MIRSMLVVAATLTLILPGNLQAASREWSVTRSSASHWSYGDRSVSYDITLDDISPTPEWADPSTEAPPLTIGQAVDISKKQLALYLPEVSDWVLGGIKLQLFDEPNRWYYIVSWRPAAEERDHWLHVPVLMNGVSVKLVLEAATPARKSH
jgi:hypothetical protein